MAYILYKENEQLKRVYLAKTENPETLVNEMLVLNKLPFKQTDKHLIVLDSHEAYRKPLSHLEVSDDWSSVAVKEVVVTPTQEQYATVIQNHVDATAASKGYADGVALASYKDSSFPAWAAEATAFINWRDSVWLFAYTELAAVTAGQKPAPTIENLINSLPVISWQ